MVGGNKLTNVKCRYFMNNGYCFYGDACQFLHAAPSMNGGDVHSPSTHGGGGGDYYSSEGECSGC